MKRLLNVGGNNKTIDLPPQVSDFEHVLLDIDPRGEPDIVCDARQLTTLEPSQFDAIYCSHNLEHYHPHEVPRVLAGFVHLLKPDGFALVRVPDLLQVMRSVLERRLDIDSVLYSAGAGPITVQDVIYGWGQEIESSGNDFFSHKTGFSPDRLRRVLMAAGFVKVYLSVGNWEIGAVALRSPPTEEMIRRFNLPRPAAT